MSVGLCTADESPAAGLQERRLSLTLHGQSPGMIKRDTGLFRSGGFFNLLYYCTVLCHYRVCDGLDRCDRNCLALAGPRQRQGCADECRLSEGTR